MAEILGQKADTRRIVIEWDDSGGLKIESEGSGMNPHEVATAAFELQRLAMRMRDAQDMRAVTDKMEIAAIARDLANGRN